MRSTIRCRRSRSSCRSGLLTIVVPDDVVTTVVKAIIKVNQTGKAGDGKIFVSAVDGALRVRTGEKNGEAIA